MAKNNILLNNINIIQRKLTGLGDYTKRTELSLGQIKFIQIYLELINDYMQKSFDIFDDKKYGELLDSLEDR